MSVGTGWNGTRLAPCRRGGAAARRAFRAGKAYRVGKFITFETDAETASNRLPRCAPIRFLSCLPHDKQLKIKVSGACGCGLMWKDGEIQRELLENPDILGCGLMWKDGEIQPIRPKYIRRRSCGLMWKDGEIQHILLPNAAIPSCGLMWKDGEIQRLYFGWIMIVSCGLMWKDGEIQRKMRTKNVYRSCGLMWKDGEIQLDNNQLLECCVVVRCGKTLRYNDRSRQGEIL